MAYLFNKMLFFFNKKDKTIQLQEKLSQSRQALEFYIDGLESFKGYKYKEALNSFDSAIMFGLVNKPSIFEYRGLCFQLLDRHLSAIKDFTKYMDLNPKDWDIYGYRAESFKEMHNFENQFYDLEMAINILTKKKRLTEEEENNLRNNKSELRKCKINIDYHIELKKIKDSFEDMLEKTVRDNIDDKNPKVYIKKKYDPSYEQAIKKGLKFDQENKFSVALEYYDYAILQNTNDSSAIGLRAFCLQALEFHKASIDDFTKAIQITSDDAIFYFGRATSYFALKNHSAAVEDGEKAVFYADFSYKIHKSLNDKLGETNLESSKNLYLSYLNYWRISYQGELEKN